jgi:hypothetical protein
MRKTCAVTIVVMLLAISTLSGCILAVDDDGFGHGYSHDGNRGDLGDHGGGSRGGRR